MSIVDQINNLHESFLLDQNFSDLKEALEMYHKMVENGTLIPRERTIQDNYAVFVSDSNLHYSISD